MPLALCCPLAGLSYVSRQSVRLLSQYTSGISRLEMPLQAAPGGEVAGIHGELHFLDGLFRICNLLSQFDSLGLEATPIWCA